jgi:EAL domain-containing protein (putative c-di-GMP-specific phosphodiesterase class I)
MTASGSKTGWTGYLFSKPLPADAFEEFLFSHRQEYARIA